MIGARHAVGQPIGRLDGPDKVTGQTRYVNDMPWPGVLVGRCLRSPLAHARILRIDASAARDLPGVRAVLTGFDIPEVLIGRVMRDIPILPRDLVRFAGQKVAAVVAESKDIAEEALSLIDVEYEVLPAVFDVHDAMAPGAPILHPQFNDYIGKPMSQESPSNLVVHRHYEKGDLDAGFADADYVFENTFQTPHQHQAYLEPHVCILEIQPDGSVEVWVNSKVPFMLRSYLALGIGVPEGRIRVNPVPIGGDFGGKGSFMDTPIAYFLSRASGCPVTMSMDYVEEFQAANPRHPSLITFKTGVRRDGTFTARQATICFNSGAYAAFKPTPVLTFGNLASIGPYDCSNARVDSYMVYTNLMPCGFLRAPGEPQINFASESQVDIIAQELGMDPYELRRRNLPEDGSSAETNHGAKEARGILLQGCQKAGYWSSKPKRPFPVGRGMAMVERHVGGGESSSKVIVESDGSVTLRTAVFDTGTGVHTILRQIVAQELGVWASEVRLVPWTTDDTENDSGSKGSSVTHVMGTATLVAARRAKEALVTLAVDLFSWPEDLVQLGEGKLTVEGGQSITLAELVATAGNPIQATGEYKSDTANVHSYAVQVAEVEVDPETGQVYLRRVTTAHDVGTIINPLAHQGQIDGAFVQGLGFALMEEIQQEQGRPTTVNFSDYKIPTIADVPELSTVLIEAEGGPGPYGSRAIGEHAIATVAPAIANAVYDAIGVRITRLPITAEKIHQALSSP